MDLNIYEFASAWQREEYDPLVRYPKATIISVPEESRELLRDVGLPGSAAPFLSFGDEDAQLVPVAEVWGLDGPEYRHLLTLGETGEGDPICLREGDGAVFALNHDCAFEIRLVNTSVVRLAYFLLAYRTFMNKAVARGAVAVSDVDQVTDRMRQIDPPALGSGAFWRNVLDWQAAGSNKN